MAHGHQDYGSQATLATVYSLQDMAELAARLGSIVKFDRRGNVIFLEDFEGSLSRCFYYFEVDDGTVVISNAASHSGDFSCKLTTAVDVGAGVELGFNLAYPVLSNMGLEFSWNMADNLLSVLEFVLHLFDGTTRYEARVRWVNSTNKWQYLDSSNNWVDLTPTVSYYTAPKLFNHVKLVADFINKKYVRLIANDQVYDLADIALRALATGTAAKLNPYIDIYTSGGACTVYIDDVIITQNEP